MKWIARVTLGVVMLATLALGMLWRADRARHWDRPAWNDRSFVRLKGDAERGEPVRWVMAVNLGCPHCMKRLRATQTVWRERGWQPDLIALLVDTPRRMSPAELRAFPAAQVWWDARGIWRRRWGHRIYGEILHFDRSGRHLRTMTAEHILERSRLPDPEREPAPVEHSPDGG
jgi:hypothetical protein